MIKLYEIILAEIGHTNPERSRGALVIRRSSVVEIFAQFFNTKALKKLFLLLDCGVYQDRQPPPVNCHPEQTECDCESSVKKND